MDNFFDDLNMLDDSDKSNTKNSSVTPIASKNETDSVSLIDEINSLTDDVNVTISQENPVITPIVNTDIPVKNTDIPIKNTSSALEQTETYIGESCQIDSLTNVGKLTVAGTIGKIHNDGDVTILPTATITEDIIATGDVTITNANCKSILEANSIHVQQSHINGNLQGNYVELHKDTIMIGDLTCDTAIISGAVNGNINVRTNLKLMNTAIIKGSVKAASLQIDSGAILDGSCTLINKAVDFEKIFLKDKKKNEM